MREVGALRQPHRAFGAEVGKDGDDVVGDVNDLLQPVGQVLAQDGRDELVEPLLHRLGQSGDGQLSEQPLVDVLDQIESGAQRGRERFVDAVGVLGEPNAAGVGRRAVAAAGGAVPATVDAVAADARLAGAALLAGGASRGWLHGDAEVDGRTASGRLRGD